MNKKALCIGNQSYPGAELKNPSNDATSVSAKLEALGFTCHVVVDGAHKDMQLALKDFRDSLDDSEVGLLFFAGHGMQIDGENYLNAIDTDFDSETDAKFSSLPLNKCIETLEKGANETSIIILDACRNNPYERKWRGSGEGLASVFAPKGTIIAYATSPGQAAFDGVGENGAFTSALLDHIDVQNVTIEDLFKRVRNTLSAATSGKQTSWEHTSLMGDFFFNTSILTGEFVTEYSSLALADGKFERSDSPTVDDAIQGLRSHSWYPQNSAVDKITPAALEGADKDSLFVLGRNVYQAACGTAHRAESFLGSLRASLLKFDDEVAFHMLNGILFEIYFDSAGRFRKTNKKTFQLDDVMALEEQDEFAHSFAFIRQSLLPHQKQLFYMPGSARDVMIDVRLEDSENEKKKVRSVFFDGQDVLYTSDGATLAVNAEQDYLYSRGQEGFEDTVQSEMAVPKQRLKITYTPKLADEAALLVPYDAQLLRISQK